MGKSQHRGLSKSEIIRRIIFITIGAALYAIGLEFLLVPNHIIDGGIIGSAIILSHLTSINFGTLALLLNLPFLIFGYKQIGKTFIISTVFALVVMAVLTTFFHHFEPFTDDLILATIFGGIVIGVGVGLVIRFGGSMDGVEITSIVISRKTPFSVGELIMFPNIFILGGAGFVFGWDRAMYSLIAYFICYKVIDITVEGLDESKSVWIISEHSDEIGSAIIQRLGRSVTYLQGEGGFTSEDRRVIFCVITRLEEAKLKAIVDEIDLSAFMAIGNIHDVKGGRFKKKAIH